MIHMSLLSQNIYAVKCNGGKCRSMLRFRRETLSSVLQVSSMVRDTSCVGFRCCITYYATERAWHDGPNRIPQSIESMPRLACLL